MARLTKKQKDFLILLEKSASNVSAACKKMGISRQTHYEWLDKSDTYKKEVENLQDSLIDFAETKLMEKIKEGDTTANIFFLKTKAKHRGYSERTEIEHSGGVNFKPKNLNEFYNE